jgi:hypothetical protein
MTKEVTMETKQEAMSNMTAMINGEFRRLTVAEAKAMHEADVKAEADRIAAGGCPHPIDEWDHEYDEDSLLGDAYYCGRCNELMQVG